ncbi:MAG: hypothetical protein V4864_16045 [Pseudomonadota bacterium]
MQRSVPWELEAVVAAAIDERYKASSFDKLAILKELANSLLLAFPDRGAGVPFDGSWDQREKHAKALAADGECFLWAPIERLVGDADASVERYPDDGKQQERWAQSGIAKLDGPKDVDDSAGVEGLADCSVNYCRAEWANSPRLELWLVRKMVYAETFAFSRQAGVPAHLKSVRAWWHWIKATIKWLIGLGVAVSIGEVHGVAAGVLVYLAWVALVRYLANDFVARQTSLLKLFLAMRNAYSVAMRGAVCPIDFERAISIAEQEGAVWPTGLRMLVERAKRRNRLIWE